MLLDSLGIDYDIHEASGRVGGRIYTHRFDQEAWDKSTPEQPGYYDYYVRLYPVMLSGFRLRLSSGRGSHAVSAMTPGYMERILGAHNWSLIPYINSHIPHINSHPKEAKKNEVVQIPYFFKANSTFDSSTTSGRSIMNRRALINLA